MAICNSPVSVTTSSSSSHADSDLDFSIRKRFGGKGKAVADSSLETETEAAAAVLEAEKSVGEVGSGGDRGESGSQVVMNGENGVAEVAAKFAYRPCAPAHRKVKESPLSSDAIFRQVGECVVRIHTFSGVRAHLNLIFFWDQILPRILLNCLLQAFSVKCQWTLLWVCSWIIGACDIWPLLMGNCVSLYFELCHVYCLLFVPGLDWRLVVMPRTVCIF